MSGFERLVIFVSKSHIFHTSKHDEFCNKTASAVLFAFTSVSPFPKKFYDTFWELEAFFQSERSRHDKTRRISQQDGLCRLVCFHVG